MTSTGKPELLERVPSANDRFRSRWNAQVRWSTTLAVVVHAAVFGLAPAWGVVRPTPERTRWEGLSLVALPPLDGLTNATGVPAGPLPTPVEEEESDARDGLEDGAVLTESEADPIDLWDAIGERLRRKGGLVPTIVEPETVAESDIEENGRSGSDSNEDAAIGGDAVAIDMSELPEPGELDLDRLATIRPELAIQLPSAWVLIRNPTEVETFLRRGYLEGTLDPEASGSVSVTLWIDQRGAVQWAEISESSGRPDLDEYALAVFNEVAAFRAAREDGVSVSRSVTLSVNFPW